jgi:transposase
MNSHQYIGLDVHKKSIWFCAKNLDGKILQEGQFPATQEAIEQWCQQRPAPWTGLMEATMFSHWIYDAMARHASEMRMGHPASMKEVFVIKHKSDRNDARRFADMCRNQLVRTVYVMPPPLRALRQQLRVRRLLHRQIVQLKNRMAALLMEAGIVFIAKKLHTERYYQQLVENPATPKSVQALLRMLHSAQGTLHQLQKTIFRNLESAPELKERLQRLRTIPGVGRMMALTWALEVGDVKRLPCYNKAVSYCGLISAQNESAGKSRSGPLSKIRNPELQTMLIEVAQVAPRLYWRYKELHDQTAKTRHHNAATIRVARQMVRYLLAVDRSGQPFRKAEPPAVG